MPTSYGLAYSTCSLPRSGWTIGAFRSLASAVTSACAPAQPAPQRSVTAPASLSSDANRSRSRSLGRSRGLGGASQAGGVASSDASATSQERRPRRHRSGRSRCKDLRQLLGARHQLDVVAAFREQALGMGGLEVVDADLPARNMRGDRQHRHTAAMTIVKPVDEVQVARTAATGADRKLAGEMRLGAGGEGRGFLVAHMNPVDAFDAAQRVGEPVERIAYDAVDTPDTGLLQRFRHEVGSGSRHVDIPLCRRG